MLEHKIPPPLVAILCLGLMLALASLNGLTINSLSIASLSFTGSLGQYLALVLFGLGVSIDLVSVAKFFRSKTTINPLTPEKSAQLVTSGLFAVSRNPMYLGMLLWLLAALCYLAEPVAVIGPVVFVLFINRFQIAPEERALTEIFADDYHAYCQNTPRWLLFK